MLNKHGTVAGRKKMTVFISIGQQMVTEHDQTWTTDKVGKPVYVFVSFIK